MRVRRLRRGEAVACSTAPATVTSDARAWPAARDGRDHAGAPGTRARSPLRADTGVRAAQSDRVEWLIEKATELGVTACSRSTARTRSAAVAQRHARWRHIAAAAASSAAVRGPLVADPIELAPCSTRGSACYGRKGGGADLLRVDAAAARSVQLIVVPRRVHRRRLAAAAPPAAHRSIRPRILRAETARHGRPLVQARWGDLRARC